MGKLLAAIVIVVALAAVAGLALWPGTVIGVSNGALGESLGRVLDDEKAPKCSGEGDRRRCTRDGASVEVTLGDYGCWDAKRAEGGSGKKPGRGEVGVPADLSGCVRVLDLVGIG